MARTVSGPPDDVDVSIRDAVARDGPAADDVDLRDSLAGLSRLGIGQGRQGLEDLLIRVAAFAVNAIPGADGAGLTLLEQGRPDTIVATAGFVREVDAIQYDLGEGPCITAAAERRTVTSGSLGEDGAFPRFGPQMDRLGVHSVVSLPLLGSDAVLGAMNVYAHAKHAFDARAVRLGELFAMPAATSVQIRQALFQARQLATQLQAVLDSRATIDHAVGILISRYGDGPEEAYERLRAMSRSESQNLSVVAQTILDEAVQQARPSHTSH